MLHRHALRLRIACCCALLAGLFPAAVRAQSTEITPVDHDDLSRIAPLLDRGAVILAPHVDEGTASRPTIFVRVHAPLATVRDVIAAPEHYPTFMPAVSDVMVLSRHGSRAAFRFRASAAVFDVTADATMHVVGDHRIDVAIAASDLGPSASRWEMFSLTPMDTVVALTVWTDPSQASWVVRNFANASGYGASGANLTVETVLALAVKRRAEIVAGSPLPIRPSRVVLPSAAIAPPPPGAWSALAERVNVVVLTLDPDGALRSATALGATRASATSVVQRLLDPSGYAGFWPWMHDTQVVSRATDAVRFRLGLSAPLAPAHGEIVATVNPARNVITLEGATGDFVGERHRWDIFTNDGFTFVMYTAAAEPSHVPLFQRALMERDPWAIVGMTAYWNVVTVRFGLGGLY